jgi:hypothetical protein
VIKVCHLITSLDLGGAEQALVNLIRELPQSHFRNEVVSLVEPGLFAEELRAAGIPVVSLDMPRGSPTVVGLGRLVRHLRTTKPTILQTWLYHADLLGTVARQFVPGLRLLWNVRCSDMVSAPGSQRLNRIMWLLARLSRQPDAVIANSESGKSFHENFGYAPRRWVQISNGVDTTRFRPRPDTRKELRARLGVDPQAYVIGMAARYHPMKDHQSFLQAAARFALAHPSARFVLCGKGCDNGNEHLMRMIAEAGLLGRVILLGIQRNVEMLYPCFDLLTLASAYGEGSPNVLLEAMACGVPCVSTDVGDSRQMIGDAGLVVVTRKDPGELAAAWETMASWDPVMLASRARCRAVDNFQIDQICLEYKMLYREIALSSLNPRLGRPNAESIKRLSKTSISN